MRKTRIMESNLGYRDSVSAPSKLLEKANNGLGTKQPERALLSANMQRDPTRRNMQESQVKEDKQSTDRHTDPRQSNVWNHQFPKQKTRRQEDM